MRRPPLSAPLPPFDTRERLLQAAIEVFAERGYASASTREICRRAGANSAAVHYHFGDKANLYREVFRSALDAGADLPQGEMRSRREALAQFYRGLLAPLAGDARHRHLCRLHAREEVEPSGVLGNTLAEVIRPRHARLVAMIVRELGLPGADVEAERLAFALVGMGTAFYHVRHLVAQFEPRLTSGSRWLDRMADRLADYALALLDAEAARRTATPTEVHA